MFCRLGAVKLSLLRPSLEANGVKMVAVGLEQLGAEEFVEQKFFDGDVYVDEEKKTYQDLGYKRFSWLSIWTSVFRALFSQAMSEARAQNISSNLAGDGLQNGGLLIVSKGGEEVLLNHREETIGDHVSNEVILERLGIAQLSQPSVESGTQLPSESGTTSSQQPECTDTTCD